MSTKRVDKDKRKIVYKKYDGHCAYCGRTIEFTEMQVNHLEPRGTNDVDNLMPSCRLCNCAKGQRPLETFRKSILCHALTAMKTFDARLATAYSLLEFRPRILRFYFEEVSK